MQRGRLFLTTDAVGGVWQYSLDLARGALRHGLAVDLAVLGPSRPQRIAEAEGEPRVTVLTTGLPLDWTARDESELRLAAGELARLARKRGAELIHLNAAGLGCEEDWPGPLVTTLHSCVATWWRAVKGSEPLPKDFAWRRAVTAEVLHLSDAVIVPSRAMAAALKTEYGDLAEPAVVHNGRDGPGSTTPAALASSEIFTCGRLWDEAKNAATLDAAAKRLTVPIAAAGPLSGPQGEGQPLQHLALMGELGSGEVRAQLRRTGIYVSAALYEPFGLSVLEAAQEGCALVLSDIPTFRELWNGAALFVAPRSAEALARALESLLASRERRGELGRAAQQRAARFTSASMVEGTLAIYRAAFHREPQRVAAL